MSGMNRLQRGALSATTNVLAHAGPRLMRVKPLRRTITGYFETWLEKALQEERASGRYPAGVNDDRATMTMALLHTVERAFCERYLAPNVLRRVSENMVLSALVDRGDRVAAETFRDQYGTHPPAFMVVAPGKTCNLRCTGCYADAGPTAERLDWLTFDRIITELKELWGGRFCVVTGGEPFAYRSEGKGVLDIAEKHQDMFFMAYSNGTLVNNRVAARLAEVGNFTPAFSVEGWRERTDTRRGDGVFDQVLEAMERLYQVGVPYGISLTATRDLYWPAPVWRAPGRPAIAAGANATPGMYGPPPFFRAQFPVIDSVA